MDLFIYQPSYHNYDIYAFNTPILSYLSDMRSTSCGLNNS